MLDHQHIWLTTERSWVRIPGQVKTELVCLLNSETLAHPAGNRNRSKLRVCDLTIQAGVKCWESYSPLHVSVCLCVGYFL